MVALVLGHVARLTGQNKIEVKQKLLEEFGLSRQAYYRGLQALEAGGVINVERQLGKRAKVKLLERPQMD